MTGAKGREHFCQEASPLSREAYIPCNAPAVAVIDNGDSQPYWMCAACADHNVKNRGAVRLWSRNQLREELNHGGLP